MNLDFRCDKAVEGARLYALAIQHHTTCGECRFAQAFALQPQGAMCTRLHKGHTGRVVTFDLPACSLFEERAGKDLGMALPRPRSIAVDAGQTQKTSPAVMAGTATH